MTIDVHAHCVPGSLLEQMRDRGPELGVELDESGRAVIDGSVTTLPLREDLTELSSRLEAMDRAGIDVQMLSIWIDLTAHALDAERGTTWARLVNECLAGEAANGSERLVALATVPLQDPDAAAAELRHAVSRLDMVGVEIATTVAGVDLVSADLEGFWRAAAELRCLVLLHPVAPLAGIDLRRHLLDNIVGRPAETTIAVSRLLLAGVLERHPELRLCIVHGGGFLPYQIGRVRRAVVAKPAIAGADIVTEPLQAARSLYFDTVLHEPAALRYLIDLVGVEQILLGTDHPFEMGDPDPVATIDAIPGLTEHERHAILEGNARRLLADLRIAGVDQGG